MAYKKQKEILRQEYGNRCMLCERPLQKAKQSAHHRIPLKNHGKNEMSNMCILCMPCQSIIHIFEYGTESYEKLNDKISRNMIKYRKISRYKNRGT